jgi:hypothetical protein
VQPSQEPHGFHLAEGDFQEDAAVVEVKPGEIVVFVENLVHTVTPTDWKARERGVPMLRLHTGFHVAPLGTSCLYPGLRERLRAQAVLPIKSGHVMPLCPVHMGTHTKANVARMDEWAEKAGLHPSAAEVLRAFVRGSKGGSGVCPSLSVLGLLLAPYTEEEEAIFFLRGFKELGAKRRRLASSERA